MSIKFLVILILINSDTISGLLPPNIPICRRNDPYISDCIVKSVSLITPKLANGDLGGGFIVPPLEPFHINDISFGDDNGLKVHLSDINIRGASKLKIEKLRANAKDIRFDVIVGLPKLDVSGKYKMSFNFLGSKLHSNGDYFTQFTGARLKLLLKGYKNLRNGVDFIKFEQIQVKFDRGNVSQLKLTNLFGGNKVISDIVHSVLANNKEFVLKNIYPSLELELSKKITAIANKVVEFASYDEIFPL